MRGTHTLFLLGRAFFGRGEGFSLEFQETAAVGAGELADLQWGEFRIEGGYAGALLGRKERFS